MPPSLTIIHISDVHLHIGGRLSRRFGGWTPHQHFPHTERPREHVVERVRAQLASELESAAEAGDELVGVLSGDVSLMGKERDIRHALDWWHGIVGTATSQYVYGNHDYWKGRVLVTAAMHWFEHDRVPPARGPVVDLPGLRVRFYTLDSTPVITFKNAGAQGELRTVELKALSQLVSEDLARDARGGRPSLRILVMHHPMLVPWWRAKKLAARNGVTPRAALQSMHPVREHLEALDEIGIGLVLTGHTHNAALHHFNVVQAIAPSGTITPPSGYWVHRLEVSAGNGDAALRSTRYELEIGGFSEVATPGPYSVYADPASHRA